MQDFQHGEVGIGKDEEFDMPVLRRKLVPAFGDFIEPIDLQPFFQMIGRQHVDLDARRNTHQAERQTLGLEQVSVLRRAACHEAPIVRHDLERAGSGRKRAELCPGAMRPRANGAGQRLWVHVPLVDEGKALLPENLRQLRPANTPQAPMRVKLRHPP